MTDWPRASMRSMISLLFLLYWGQALSASEPCTNEQLGRLIPKAQRLAQETPKLYQGLLDCQQEAIRDNALQWASFYLVMNGDLEGPRKLQAQRSRSTAKDDLGRDIDKARHGDYQALKRMISGSVSGYYDSATAILALSRALMRDGKYEEAFSYYRNYLRLKPEDDLIAVELLYAYIWGGDIETAQSYFRALASYKTSPFLEISLDNATWVMDNVKKSQTGGAVLVTGAKGSMRLGLQQQQESRGFARRSVGVVYDGLARFELVRHQLTSKVYDGITQEASEFNASYSREFSKVFVVDGMAGYFAADSSRVYGRLALRGTFGDAGYELGWHREPLAISYPMAAGDLDLMRNSGYMKASLLNWLTVGAVLAKDEKYAAFEKYDLRVSLPLGQQGADGSSLALVFPASYEHHPKPGPLFNTYPQSQTMGAGLLMQRHLPKRWQAALETTYHMIARNSFGDSSHTDFADRFVADLGLSYPWYDDLSLGFKGIYDIEKEQGRTGESWKTNGISAWIDYSL